jgi:hypothetical protein
VVLVELLLLLEESIGVGWRRGPLLVGASACLRWGNKGNIWFWHHWLLSLPLGHHYSNPSPRPSTSSVGGGGGLEVEYFESYPHFSVLTGEVMHGLELTQND